MVKMMKWKAALFSRKFEARLVVKRLEGLEVEKDGRLRAEIKWKGSKTIAGLSSFRGVKRDKTSDGVYDDDGVLCWNEEFRNFCSFIGFKDNGLCSWDVVVTVVNVSSQESKKKATVVGKAMLNLSEYVASGQVQDVDISVPLTLKGSTGSGSGPSMMISLSLLEVKCAQDAVDHGCASPCDSASSPEKARVHSPRNGQNKVNLFTGCVGTRRLEITKIEDENSSDGKFSNETQSVDEKCPDSIEALHEEGFSDEGKDETAMLQPLSYGPLTYVNIGHFIPTYSSGVDDWLYYSSYKIHDENSATSAQDPSLPPIPKHKFLSWRKRKLRFKSSRSKGEPLLKKDCRDEGGDDIDFDRRQLTSSDDSSYGWHKTEDGSTASRSSFSEFEDDGFCVGAWEQKEITSRDGHMKLETQVFFASMDQRSERAAGESACTALVAVIAEWLQNNICEIPIKSEFDRLIRDGSSEWRNMCESQIYIERFPDKHFDLETVLKAKVRHLSVIPEKSFVGFFHPEGIAEESCFDILRGSMSFDEIWDEISRQASEASTSCTPLVYIVSWNDHFFILKVEQDAYYIIDTLGERLYEGCNQAYILKFDYDTKIKQAEASSETSPDSSPQASYDEASVLKTNAEDADGGLASVSSGKESCKEYIKSFLSAIPIRQLQEDVKKGLTSISVHQRLQIEFHFTDVMR